MHKISILYSKIYAPDADLDALLSRVKAAGIDGFDFSLYVFEQREPGFYDKPLPQLLETFRPFKEAFLRHGLAVCQTHSPLPSYKYGDEKFNAYMIRAHKMCLEITRFLDCNLMVMHPAHAALVMTPDQMKAESVAMYSALIEDARRTGVKILLENMWARREGGGSAIFESACGSAEQSVDWIDTLNAMAGEELFGYCFDVGHATLCGKQLKNFLVTLGHRVKALHIHDVDHNNDNHTIPYAFSLPQGQPVTDWQGMLDGLRAINYQGAINFEAPVAFRTYPKALHGLVLRMFHDIGAYFSSEIERE